MPFFVWLMKASSPLTTAFQSIFRILKNPKIADHIKLHHLLTHTSGLPDNRRKFLDAVFLLTAKDQETGIR